MKLSCKIDNTITNKNKFEPYHLVGFLIFGFMQAKNIICQFCHLKMTLRSHYFVSIARQLISKTNTPNRRIFLCIKNRMYYCIYNDYVYYMMLYVQCCNNLASVQQHSISRSIWNSCIIYLHYKTIPTFYFASDVFLFRLDSTLLMRYVYTYRRCSNENCLCHVIKSKTFHNAANEKWNM